MNAPRTRFSMPKLPLALALLSVLTACSPSRDDGRNERKERREAKHANKAGSGRDHAGKSRGRIMKFDKNGDGIITADEVPAGKERRFKRMDTNGDGQLTGDELNGKSGAGR